MANSTNGRDTDEVQYFGMDVPLYEDPEPITADAGANAVKAYKTEVKKFSETILNCFKESNWSEAALWQEFKSTFRVVTLGNIPVEHVTSWISFLMERGVHVNRLPNSN